MYGRNRPRALKATLVACVVACHLAAGTAEAQNPRSLRDLGRHVELDAGYRFVSALAFRLVPRYHTADLRLGWRPSPSLEIAVAGHDLLGAHHLAFNHDPGPSAGISRRVSLRLTWSRP
jgi:iron complex outermembrane receptor protein